MFSDAVSYQFKSPKKTVLKVFSIGSFSLVIFFSLISLTFTIGYFTRVLTAVSRDSDSLPQPDIIQTIKYGFKPTVVTIVSFVSMGGVFFFFTGIALSLAAPSNIGTSDTVMLSFIFGTGTVAVLTIIHLIPISLFYYVQSQTLGAFFDINRFLDYLNQAPIRHTLGYSLLSLIIIGGSMGLLVFAVPHFIVLLPLAVFYHSTVVAYVYGYHFGNTFGTRISNDVSIPDQAVENLK